MDWQNESQEERKDGQEIIRQIMEHCKKITEALYRITDLFPRKEPLKWSLREEGVKIFKLFISLSNKKFVKEKVDLILKIKTNINQIIYLLEIASSNSFITGINFTVLKREYLRLKSAVTEHESLYSENEELINIKNLPAFNFLTDNPAPQKTNNIDLSQLSIINSNGHLEDLKDIKDKEEYNNMSFKMSISENTLKHNHNNGHKENNEDINNETSNNGIKTDTKRSVKILDIIKSTENGFMSINEVYGHFKGISKKTIQRELIGLVRGGALRMDGEKRWRRYMLNKI